MAITLSVIKRYANKLITINMAIKQLFTRMDTILMIIKVWVSFAAELMLILIAFKPKKIYWLNTLCMLGSLSLFVVC